MTRQTQSSFSKGEVSPALFGRVDTEAYKLALKKARNCLIHPQGGVSNRPGTKFIGKVKDHTAAQRLIKFQFKTDDTYVLEFGNLYMRAIREDAHVLNTAVNISAATQANPVVVTTATHNYANGDDVFITGVVGMTEINDQTFTIANIAATTFELTDQVTGSNIDGSAFTAYSSAGTAADVFEIVTPYTAAQLFDIKFTQDADVMTLVHVTHAPRELTRTGHTSWTLATRAFEPDHDNPTGVQVSAATAASETERYKVTAVAEETNEESLAGLDNTATASASATAASPVVVTAASHPFLDGDIIEISGYVEMTEVNGRQFIVSNKATNTFELTGEDGSSYAAESSGGSVFPTFTTITNGNATRDNTISWTEITGTQRYRIYRQDNGIYGFIGETELTSFLDSNTSTNITADTTISPPRSRDPFIGTDNFPGAVSFYEQRRVFGGSNNKPDRSWFTQTGRQNNMSVSVPSQADDAITTDLNSKEVNEIRHYVAGDDIIAFTSGAEWKINAGDQAFLGASTIRQKQQSEWGSSQIRPLVVGETILFVPDNKASIRSFGNSSTTDKYKGIDISRLAEHLFENATVVDWCFAKYPEPVVYCVMSTGDMATVTFDTEQEVIAWTTWDTLGKYKTCATLTPDSTSKDEFVYYVVERTINSNTVRYVERTVTRRFDDVRDVFFVDSGLTLDTPVVISGATAADPVVVTVTAHPFANGAEIDISDIEWAPQFDTTFTETNPDQLNNRRFIVTAQAANTITLLDTDATTKFVEGITRADPAVVTSSAHGFADGDIIGILDVVGMTAINGLVYKVANKTADTFELTDEANVNIDSSGFSTWTSGGSIRPGVDGSAFKAYVESGKARQTVTTVSGLRHLVGEGVIVLANGNVVEDLTVSATGTLTLADNASRVHVGLRYIADVETLDIDDFRGTTDQGEMKQISAVTVKFKKSRGLLIGADTDNLVEMVQREFEDYGAPTDLLTGSKEIQTLAQWNDNGRLFFRQKDPLPMTLLSITPEVVDEGD